MFKKVGKELKVWALLFLILNLLGHIATTALIWYLLPVLGVVYEFRFPILIGCVILAVINFLLTRFFCCLVFAYGDMVDNTRSLDYKMNLLLHYAQHQDITYENLCDQFEK